YDRARQALKARFTEGRTDTAPVTRTDELRDTRKIYTYQPDPVLGHDNDPGEVADLPFRINEAYVNVARGRLFLRLGRQAISWGESDTIALLDQSNPFNLTLGLPGAGCSPPSTTTYRRGRWATVGTGRASARSSIATTRRASGSTAPSRRRPCRGSCRSIFPGRHWSPGRVATGRRRSSRRPCTG